MSSVAVEESTTPTDSPVYRLKHKWTVQKFASTYLVNSTDKDYPQVYSTWFSSSRDSALKFWVLLYPNGEDETNQNNLGLYIQMNRTRPPPLAKTVDVKLKFSLLNDRSEKCHSLKFRRKLEYPSDNWGWPTFLKHSVLLDPYKGLLPADTLTILAEISVFPEPVIPHESQLAKLKVASMENVRASLVDLLHSGDHSDVILVVDGGAELAAHKVILSLHSPVFSAMFKTEMAEQMEGKVKIPDMKVDVAHALLRFIYTGVVANLEEYAEELLVAADKYDVAFLKELCGQHLCGQVNTENAARLFAIADRHSVDQLKCVAFDYIQGNLKDVLLTDDWLLVHELVTKEFRQLKLKEKQGGEKGTPEESESVN